MLRKFKKIAKMIGWTILSLLVLILIVGFLFVNLSPEFGDPPSKELRMKYEKESENYYDKSFRNLDNVTMQMKLKDMPGMILKFLQKQPDAEPEQEIPVISHSADELLVPDSSANLIWFGHSSFLLQIAGKNILIDPMLGEVPAPHPLLGNKRFNSKLPLEIEELPKIDAVLLSHDHYDHLDYGSIMKLKSKVSKFYVPLGLGSHLRSWGVDSTAIEELDWWQEAGQDSLKLSLCPAQHFSGRGLSDRGATLWGSWMIEIDGKKIFFSGDSGYGRHFKEIKQKFGKVDFAMLECGQYNMQWKEIHMMPEETALAAQDLEAAYFMPIHWGSFKLALHPWYDPVVRVSKKAEEIDQNIVVPKIGEIINLNKLEQFKTEIWW